MNASLLEGVERLQVIALTPYIDGEKLNHGPPEQQAEENARLLGYDSVMASVIEREALRQSRKMLVYCGMNHALTRFAQPSWDEETWTFAGKFQKNRAGQRLYQQYPGRVITLALHSPHQYPAYQAFGLPFGGVVDQVLLESPRPVGFDVPQSPFGPLVDSQSVYALEYGSIRFADYCDGYIVLDQVKNYSNVTFIPTWFDDVSFSDFKKQFIKPLPAIVFHPLILKYLLEGDADMTAKFKDLPPALDELRVRR